MITANIKMTITEIVWLVANYYTISYPNSEPKPPPQPPSRVGGQLTKKLSGSGQAATQGNSVAREQAHTCRWIFFPSQRTSRAPVDIWVGSIACNLWLFSTRNYI